MARITPEQETISGIVESQKIICPEGWQKAERAVIRLSVDERDPNVGVLDLTQFVVRQWTGYWYLVKDEYVWERGAIEFAQQQLYQDHQLWFLEPNIQQGGVRVPIPETTQPEENLEEVAEWLLFGGEIIESVAASIDIPIIGGLIEQAVGLLEGISSENLTYLPTPYRPDTLIVSFPTGMASMTVEFAWWPYSPLSVLGGIGEVDIQDEIPVLELPDGQPVETQSNVTTFEELARDAGFIEESECPSSTENVQLWAVGAVTANCTDWIEDFEVFLGEWPAAVANPIPQVENDPSPGCPVGRPLAGQGVDMLPIDGLSGAGVGSTWDLVTWRELPTLERRPVGG